MARLKFDMWRHVPSVGGIMFSFTDGNGSYSETWFGSPPSSIDHVSPGYIYNRLTSATTVRHCDFIKRRYKEEIEKYREGELREGRAPVQEFTLSFTQAIEACMKEGGFIRGEDFSPGYYAKFRGEVLMLVDGTHLHEIQGNLPLSKGVFTQRYKHFPIANAIELNLPVVIQ